MKERQQPKQRSKPTHNDVVGRDAVLSRMGEGARALAMHQEQIKRQKSKPQKKHKAGAHWYELVASFDPLKIEALPIKDSGFMMGTIDDLAVIEVAEDMKQERVVQIGEILNNFGIKALIVRRGVQFLKLRTCAPGEEKRLNEIMAQQEVLAAHREVVAAAQAQTGVNADGVIDPPQRTEVPHVEATDNADS